MKRLLVLATIVVTLAAAGLAAAQPAPPPFRIEISFTTDLTNYVQADEYLDPIKMMAGIPDGPFPDQCGTPLCDPGFVGFYQDLFTVGVIDGLNVAIAYFMDGQIMRCGDAISGIADRVATKLRAVDPRLRGSTGAALTTVLTALEVGCTISK